MYYKIFDKYITIYLLLKITFKLYVSGQPVNSVQAITILSDDQLQYLAESVCDLDFFEDVELVNCQKNFIQSQFPSSLDPNSSEKSTPLKIRCNSPENIKFQVGVSQNWQLVAVVPEHTNDTEIDKYSVNYSLIPPKQEYEEVSTIPVGNYTLWSTELQFEGPLHWQGGFMVPQYNELTVPEKKNYDIKVEFFKQNVDKKTFMKALFTWNTTGDADACFDIVNSCAKTGITDIKIWPDSKPQKFFSNLSLDDECDIQVTGLYGTKKLDYRTPPLCDHDLNCAVSNRTPEYPANVSIEAIQNTKDDTWNVHVAWSAPHFPVELYNITIYSQNNRSLQVAGDKTEVVFEGVSGKGFYGVELQAKLGHKTAVTSRRAMFPGRTTPDDGAAAARGAMLCAVVLAAAVFVLAYIWRRGCRHIPQDPPEEEEPPQKDYIEDISITLETEDMWEVRSDKLLLHEVIGEGAFGVVRRATLAPDGTNVAVKMLKAYPSVEEVRSFRSEMELMKSVGVHPHLVSLVGVCSGRRPLIVAEYCSRGDLLTYLRCTWDIMMSKRNVKYYNNNSDTSDYRNDLFKSKMQIENPNLVVNKLYEFQDICDKELTTQDVLSFCRQIAMGMEFLASNRVVHRDLAARNILVTADRTLKIADFGLSRDVYEENQYKQKGNGKMPVKWMALESLTRRIYTTQSDVWSFGVVVWEVATVGASPYASVDATRLPRLLKAGYRMPRPPSCSTELYELMQSCWREAPRERPTFAELHARLDALLQAACADQYLTLELELEPPDKPPTPRHYRYLRMLISRSSKRTWSLSETYERPLKPPQSNHYSSPPQVLTKVPATVPAV